MKLPRAPAQYSEADQTAVRTELERTDARVLRGGQDVILASGERVVLKSPNGTLFALAVSNAGTLSAVAYP